MEGEPLDSVAEHHTRRHQQLGKVQRLDALVLVLLELDARRGQQLDGVLGVHVFPGGDGAVVTAGEPQWALTFDRGGRSRKQMDGVFW